MILAWASPAAIHGGMQQHSPPLLHQFGVPSFQGRCREVLICCHDLGVCKVAVPPKPQQLHGRRKILNHLAANIVMLCNLRAPATAFPRCTERFIGIVDKHNGHAGFFESLDILRYRQCLKNNLVAPKLSAKMGKELEMWLLGQLRAFRTVQRMAVRGDFAAQI